MNTNKEWISSDLGLADITLQDKAGNLIDENNIAWEDTPMVVCPVYNNTFDNQGVIPAHGAKVKFDLGTGFDIADGFDIASASPLVKDENGNPIPGRPYFQCYKAQYGAGTIQVHAYLIEDMPPNYPNWKQDIYDQFSFFVKCIKVGASMIKVNVIIADPSLWSDSDRTNNYCQADYLINSLP